MRRGSLFQIRGAEKRKARDPNDRLCRGKVYWYDFQLLWLTLWCYPRIAAIRAMTNNRSGCLCCLSGRHVTGCSLPLWYCQPSGVLWLLDPTKRVDSPESDRYSRTPSPDRRSSRPPLCTCTRAFQPRLMIIYEKCARRWHQISDSSLIKVDKPQPYKRIKQW